MLCSKLKYMIVAEKISNVCHAWHFWSVSKSIPCHYAASSVSQGADPANYIFPTPISTETRWQDTEGQADGRYQGSPSSYSHFWQWLPPSGSNSHQTALLCGLSFAWQPPLMVPGCLVISWVPLIWKWWCLPAAGDKNHDRDFNQT